jgi:hypothetical protein
VRLPESADTRLLLAGVAASLALVSYLAVAFANTHASASASGGNEFAPWVPKYHSTLAHASPRKAGGTAVHVQAGWRGAYGVVVPTLVSQPPPGSTLVLGLWLRGLGHGPIQVLVDEFPSGHDIIAAAVPATRRWHHYTFRARVKGRWLGLGLYVGRSVNGVGSRRFAVREPSAKLRGG